MAEKTTPPLSFKIGIIIVLWIIIFIAFYTDEDGPIMRAFGFLSMIMSLTFPFILYSILSKNKTD